MWISYALQHPINLKPYKPKALPSFVFGKTGRTSTPTKPSSIRRRVKGLGASIRRVSVFL